MGEVWLAHHRDQRVPVAVKVLTAEGSRRPMFVDSFRNEVRAAAALDHPNIVVVLDYGTVPERAERQSSGLLVSGTPYLSMELVRGDTLAENMGTLSWPEIARLLRSLLDALAHAHARGVIHRDLKLSNVLYDASSGTVKLTDFGIAHAMAAVGDRFRWGTPAYMPPEQLLGRWWDYGPWTDLYSLGCVGYALVVGDRPFPEDRFEKDRVLPALVPRMPVPDGFEDWLRALTDPEPNARYQRAADAAWALVQMVSAFDEAQVPAPTETPLPKAPKALDTTTTLLFDPSPPGEIDTAPAPGPLTVPPTPSRWRRRASGPRSQPLIGAGLGLYGLRRIPTIGRVQERDTLWRTLREVRSTGRARAVVLDGPAGCGKTRLGEWLCERAHEVGAASVMRASHGQSADTSEGLRGMLARFLRTGGLAPEQVRQRVTAAVLAVSEAVDPWEVKQLLELTVPGSVDAAEIGAFALPAERHGVIRRFVDAQARRRPVVMFIDDVHWGLDAIQFAASVLDAQGTAPAPVMLVLAAQDELLVEGPLERKLLDGLLRRQGALRLPVGPLSPAEHRSLLQTLLGLEGRLNRLVLERTAGNPMFAVQLVGDWVQRGILEAGPRGFQLRAGAQVRLPDDVYETWRERVDDVLRERPSDDREALEVAAALGLRVQVDQWRVACEVNGVAPSDDLIDTLLSLRLARVDDASGRGSWAFAHTMLRESLERQAVEGGRAQAIHAACAEMLLRREGRFPERVARHLLASDQTGRALVPLVESIGQRCRAGEYDRADGLLVQWHEATRSLDLEEADPLWIDGLKAAAEVHRFKDRPEQLMAVCRRLETGARSHGWDAELLAFVRLLRGRVMRRTGDYMTAVDLFRSGLRRVTTDRVLEAELYARMGATLVEIGAFEGAQAAFRKAMDLAGARGQKGLVGESQVGLAAVAIAEGDLESARTQAAKARETFRNAGHRWGMARAWEMFGEIARHRGHYDEATHCYRTAAQLWEGLGSESRAVQPQVKIALTALERGRVQPTRQALEQLAARAQSMQHRALWAMVRVAQLTSDVTEIDLEGWNRHLDEAGAVLADTGYVSPDVGMMAEVAARAARTLQWNVQAKDALDLALAQWMRLGREQDADRVQWALERLEHV